MGCTTTYQYDQAGNRTRVTDPEGISTTFGYDALNRLASVADGLNNVTTYSYDACSNLTEIVHPLGHTEFFTYDSLHRKTFSGRRQTSGGSNVNVTTYTYDSMGNLLTTTDPMANTTTYRYNLNNRLVSVTDALNNTTSYGYDANGNRTSVTNANGHTAAYTYDKMGQVTSEQLPGGYTTRWAYDGAGRVASRTDANGQVTNYTYDPVGRLARKSYPDGSQVTYTYDGAGNRLSMKDALGTTLYRYDADNNLLEVTDCYGRKNSYTYDRANRRRSLITSFGTQTYEYDGAGRLSAVTDFKGNRITLSYDADSRTTGISYPQGGTTTYTYNYLDQLTNLDSNTRNNDYYRIAYQYNQNGYINNTTIDKKYGTSNYIYNYTYDRGNRLTQVNGSNNSNTFEYHNTYTYDNLGNRLSHYLTHRYGFNWAPDEKCTYTYDGSDRLASRTVEKSGGKTLYSYLYDANGNQTNEKWGYYNAISQYDYENRLIRRDMQVTYSGGGTSLQAKYQYNGDGLLMGMVDSSGSKCYQYDGTQVIADLDGAGALIASYTRLPSGKLLSMYSYQEFSNDRKRDTFYVFNDLLGSTVMLFGKTSSFIEMFEYKEFGSYSTAYSTDPTRFTFTGAPYYTGPGVYQMGARYYNPAVGRFLTRDTYRGSIYKPWTQNLYAYCNNNPVNYVDPTGHHPMFSDQDYERIKQIPSIIKEFGLPDPNSNWDAAMLQLEQTHTPLGMGIGAAGVAGRKGFAKAIDWLRGLFKGAGKAGFKTTELFESHFAKHAGEFGNITKEQYLKGAQNLVNSKPRGDILFKTRANGDSIYIL